MKHIIFKKENLEDRPAEKLNILILSDDQNGMKIFKRVLNEKYTLLTAKNLSEAFEILSHQEIAVVIAEQQLPETKGTDFLESVKYISKNTIRILLGDFDEQTNTIDDQTEGIFHHFLYKPLSANMVNTIVDNAINSYKMTKKVQALSMELEQANKTIELRKREDHNFEEQKRRFMLIANHELRTPATIISSSLDILSTKLNHFDETERKLLDSAKTGSSRLNDTLENIYLMLNSKNNKELVYNGEINLSEVLYSLSNNIQEHLQKRKISLKILCPDSITLKGQKKKIVSLFDNLFSNAIKYTHDGGAVLLQVREMGSNILVTLKDNGIGIPASELKNIFKSFYQLGNLLNHHSSKYNFLGKGTGLGLPICKNIVEQYAGEIWAESEGENRGSKISIKLPVHNNGKNGLPPPNQYAEAV